MREQEDLDLLERWRAGDAGAGNELFERHFESLYRFFLHKCEGDAVDLVQRTFLACVEARDRFRGGSSFKTYLLGIARNTLFAHWRHVRRDRADCGASSLRDLGPSPSSILLERHEHRVLLEALRSIPLDLQIAVELHYWERMSASEIGEVLGVPIGTAKSRLRRAREALVEEIARLDSSTPLETTVASLEEWALSLKQALLQDER